MTRPRAAAAILWGGLVGGTLDLSYAAIASIARGYTAGRMLTGIAGGLLGRGVIDAGWPYALLGAGLHFFIALSAATTYWLASRRLKVLIEWPLVCGPVFGALWYLMMNRVVLPLSALRVAPVLTPSGAAAVTFLLGWPVAYAAMYFTRAAQSRNLSASFS